MTGPWVDSHCHVQDEVDPAGLLADARSAGVGGVVCVGTDLESSRRAVALAAGEGPGTWATVGLHPHDASRGVDGVADYLRSVARDPRVVAVGECGLDYHYDLSPRDAQRAVFASQVRLATELGLALVVHSREAWDDTFAVLADAGVPQRLVMHCFTGGPDEARRALDMGAHLSFSGIVSFKGAAEVRAAAALCPADRLLVETDSPYLAPAPHRGSRNRPAWVTRVGEAVAAARGTTPEEVAAATTEAARSVLGL